MAGEDEAMVDLSDHFDEASGSFLKWFTSQPGTTFHPSLRIVDLRDRSAGRGIIATADIPPDTDLFVIPRNAIISVETSELAKRLPEVFKDATLTEEAEEDIDNEDSATSSLPTSWLNLILILLYESFEGPASKWQPYLSILPSDPKSFNTPMFWTESELSALQASAISSKIGRESATNIFRSQILPVVKANSDIFYSSDDSTSHLSDEALLSRCHIIGSLIMSYAFDLQPDEDEDDEANEDANNDGWTEDNAKPPLMGMVPMADMLNADAEFNAHLSHGDDALTMTSLRTIKAGEEVLNYYGPLPNAELARRYGYTSPKHARYDVVEISWDLVRSCIIEEASQISSSATDNNAKSTKGTTKPTRKDVTTILSALETDPDREDLLEGFIIDRDSGDPNEQGLCSREATFEKFPEELVEVIREVIDALLPLQPLSSTKAAQESRTRDLKRHTISTLHRIVETRMAQYGTTIAQDEEIIARPETVGRLKMAIEVRLGEKRLLEEAKGWTEGMLRKYTPVSAPTTTTTMAGSTGAKSTGKDKTRANENGHGTAHPAKRQKRGR